MNPLEARVDRISEQLNPQPAEMVSVILVHYSEIEDREAITPPNYYVGRYATVTFLGGTEGQRREAVRRMRRSGWFDRAPTFVQPALTPADGVRKGGDDGERAEE